MANTENGFDIQIAEAKARYLRLFIIGYVFIDRLGVRRLFFDRKSFNSSNSELI
jgi:hypothetical protein